jgi:hypothetical protein
MPVPLICDAAAGLTVRAMTAAGMISARYFDAVLMLNALNAGAS